MRKKPLFLTAAVIALVALLAALVLTRLTFNRGAKITILDSRFRVLTTEICKGTNFTVFFEATTQML
jgi:hypothetical protein